MKAVLPALLQALLGNFPLGLLVPLSRAVARCLQGMNYFLNAPARRRDGFIPVGQEEDESWRHEGEEVFLGYWQCPWPGAACCPHAPAMVSHVDLTPLYFPERQTDLIHLELISCSSGSFSWELSEKH